MKKQLFTPGPTEVPPETLAALARPVLHHRKAEFGDIFSRTEKNLQKIFRSTGEVFIFAASGTGAMEAAVTNFTSEGDRALVVVSGKFGERWHELLQTFNVNAEVLEYDMGSAPEPEDIREKLDKNEDIKAVFTTLVETSTATLHPIKEISGIVKDYRAKLIVDAVSGLGCDVIETDKWGIDAVVAGSQKALMTPPGLSFVCVNKKARKAYEKNQRKNYYWDFKKSSARLKKNQTPYTSAVNLTVALLESTNMIIAEGVENVWERHRLLSKAAREATRKLGLKIFSDSPARGVTAVELPSGHENLIEKLRERYGITVAGGQADLKGRIARLGHMGYCYKTDILKLITALGITLGRSARLSEAISAAASVLDENS